LAVERCADGTVLLTHPGAMPPVDDHMLAPFVRWCVDAPDRVWVAERNTASLRAAIGGAAIHRGSDRAGGSPRAFSPRDDGSAWTTLTYAEGWAQVQAVAQGLMNLGLKRGGCLMILAPNSVDHAVASYAALATGAAICPVTPQYGLHAAGFGKLRAAFDTIRPTAVLVADGDVYGAALAALLLGDTPVIALHNPQAGQVAFADVTAMPTPAMVAAMAAIQPSDPAKYLLTSGSTGVPKVVINTHRNLCFNVAQIRSVFADDDPHTMLSALPWSHSLGANAVLHMLLYQGGSLYIDGGQPTPQRFGQTVENLKLISPTYHIAVPAAYGLLATELERDADLAASFFKNMRILQYGGAALGQDIFERIQKVAIKTCGARITFAAGYGATETAPTVSNIHWHNDVMGLIGLPVPGEVVKLVPFGDKLEIRVKGDQVTPGYLHDPVRTREAFDAEGFYKLGDAVAFADPHDPEAGLRFDGRLAEEFKLDTGTWVSAGTVRTALLSAIDGAAQDAVICGEGQAAIGVLIFLNVPYCQRLAGDALPMDRLADHPAVIDAITTGLARYNAGKPQSARVARAVILHSAPDAAVGEITDKGYINQACARAHRAVDVAKLFAPAPVSGVIVAHVA
jgi:feruloyl-CoA synthase